jgi:FtsH-binding integral membrane protein
MNRVKWALLWISLGILWGLKIMNLLPGDFFSMVYHQKYLFAVLVILFGLFLFLRNKYPHFAQWLFWLFLFLIGLWFISTTYNEQTWI